MHKLKKIPTVLVCYLILFGCSAQGNYHPQITNPLSLEGKTHYSGLAIADFNNDGIIDLAEAKYPIGEIDIRMSNTNSPLPLRLETKGEILSLEAADFDNDGRIDIIFSGGKQNPGIHVFLNQGKNNWKLKEDIADNKIYLKVKAADFNNDGRVDIAGLLSNHRKGKGFEGGLKIWLQKENKPKLISSGLNLDNPFQDFAIGDLDGDRLLDIAAADFQPYGGVKIFLGDGKGGFTLSPKPPATHGNFLSVSISDLNHDNTNDIIAGSFIYGIKIWLNNGYGGWNEYPTPAISGSFWGIVTTDINHDGIRDLIAGSFDTHVIKVWISKNNKWKKGPELIPSFSTVYSIDSFDTDRDDKLDLAAISHGKGIKLIPLTQNTGQRDSATKNSFERLNNHSSIRRVSFETFNNSNNYLIEKYILSKSSDKDGRQRSSSNGKGYIEKNGRLKYIVGPGDILSITSWKGSKPLVSSVLVREDGRISYAFLDDLLVENMTTNEIDILITERLKRFVKNPRIDVIVEKHNSRTVFLMGESKISGKNELPLKGKTTLLDLIWETGGVTDDADMKNVTLDRKGKIMSLDLSKAFTEGNEDQNPILQDGDRIRIPKDFAKKEKRQGRIYVLGEVGTPAVVKFEEGRKITIAEVFSVGQGIVPLTSSRYVNVVRGDFANPQLIRIDTQRLFRYGDVAQNIPMEDGDIVYIPRSNIQLVQDFLGKIQGISNSLVFLGLLRDTYTTGGSFLRFNTGGTLGGVEVTPSTLVQ